MLTCVNPSITGSNQDNNPLTGQGGNLNQASGSQSWEVAARTSWVSTSSSQSSNFSAFNDEPLCQYLAFLSASFSLTVKTEEDAEKDEFLFFVALFKVV